MAPALAARLLLTAAVAALTLPLLPTVDVAAGPFEDPVPCPIEPVVCPDLFVDPVKMRAGLTVATVNFSTSSCAVQEGEVPGPGAQKLLRFTFTTPNLGPGDLVVGSPSQHPEWFEWAPCHRHYHFREYADYRLWKPDYYAQWVAVRTALPTLVPEEVFAQFPQLRDGFVAGNKGGFCVIDLVDYTRGLAPANYRSCGQQGISVGWADEYSPGLSGQWVVVTNVPSGDYILEAEVNSERLYHEVDYLNNSSGIPVKI